MHDILIATKLYIPSRRPGLVERPRLAERLEAALRSERTAVIISAPAGYGKTTALVEWIREKGHPAAWLSLDDGDNDPRRFCAYLAAAVSKVFPALEEALGDTMDFGMQSPAVALTPLVNALASISEPFLIVLDDYHLIEEREIHAATAFLLERLPPQAHLVISGRADPPLPLARLRSRGLVVELHLSDLRFTQEEAVELLDTVLGLKLSTGDVAALNTRTEGWIAGLQMAAISMQGREDLSGFIRAFTGSHRYILDYLMEEALQRQPAELQEFLVQTSILERLCASLVEAVTGRPGGQATLEALERRNLFIVPLDDRREWFRYHRLFADLLQSRVGQAGSRSDKGEPAQAGEGQAKSLTYGEGLQRREGQAFSLTYGAELHRRAAEWYAHNGLTEEAIEHFLAAGEAGRAAELIDQTAEATLMRSELATLLGRIERLPESERRGHPRLKVYRAWARMWSGASRPELDDDLLEASGLEERPAGEREALDGFLALFAEQFATAGALSRHALEALPADRPLLRSLAEITTGVATITEGQTEAGMQILERTAQTGLHTGNVLAAVVALDNMAETRYKMGRLGRAEELYRQALAAATLPGGRKLPAAGIALNGLGRLALLRNELEAAGRYLSEAAELLTEGWGILGSLSVCTDLVSLALLRRDWPAAEAALEQARQIAQHFDAASIDNRVVEMLEARLFSLQGRMDAAREWITRQGLLADAANLQAERLDDPKSPRLRKYEYLTAAQILALDGRPAEALHIAEHLMATMQRFDRIVLWLHAGILAAVLYAQSGRTSEALAATEAALRSAEPERITVFFAAEGEAMRRLIHSIRPRLKDERLATFAGELLGQFPGENAAGSSLLSERELEVLRLVAEGLSNREIAERLFVSVRTVKFHTGNVFGKLGASNRTQAVARAREMGILREV